MAWTKASDKLYQIQLDGKYVDINVPYAKAHKIFIQFLGSGGFLDDTGKVVADVATMFYSFASVGDILLTSYGPKGSVVEEGDCGVLSVEEVTELFEIAVDVVENFTKRLSGMASPETPKKEKAKGPKS